MGGVVGIAFRVVVVVVGVVTVAFASGSVLLLVWLLRLHD